MSRPELKGNLFDARVVTRERKRLHVRGQVQGVGFRPFVYRLAHRLDLAGWVANGADGVVIEVEGRPSALNDFVTFLKTETPPAAKIDMVDCEPCTTRAALAFEIRPSITAGRIRPVGLTDRVTCDDCLREMRDPADRRFNYPFTSCTTCGPRFSIIDALPYDRGNTTMAGFTLCATCQAEYEDPDNRRFHAEANACPECGPQITYRDEQGETLARRNDALEHAVTDIRAGKIVALKGLGGYQVVVDAGNDDAVQRLRRRKHRPEKPFALMVRDLVEASHLADLTWPEKNLLASPAGPIVILEKRANLAEEVIAPLVAPGLPWLGLMLPTSPLHHLLLDGLGSPLVATSGNLAGEPIATDEEEAHQRLSVITNRFLTHDRPIRRPLDDSVQRIIAGQPVMLRRARGFAPLAVAHAMNAGPMLALGGQEKTTVAMTTAGGPVISQHVGDLDNEASRMAHADVIDDMLGLHGLDPERIICDAHPDYASTMLASTFKKSVRKIQHHAAHIYSCMADNDLAPPLLGFAFDGTGYGDDGTIWGGEALLVTDQGWERVATFRPFGLPGGEVAIKEPRRIGLSLLVDTFGDDALTAMPTLMPIRSRRASDLRVFKRMIETGINTPRTSSVGRLFDGIAAIIGLHQITSYSGQAAIELEGRAGRVTTSFTGAYSFGVEERDGDDQPRLMIDWRPAIRALVSDVQNERNVGEMAAAFHNGLADVMVDVATRIGQPTIALSGGCFQNRYLSEHAKALLEDAGFAVYLHRNVPPNDGGLALGQLVAAAYQEKRETG